MAMSNAQITVAGNLTRDPELRYSNSGMAVAKFAVAVQERKQVNGQWEDGDTSFFNCTAFGQHAENVAESIAKGDRAIVTGRMKIGTYDDDEGNHKVRPEILVDECGPALKWATAAVTRTGKRSSGDTKTEGSKPAAPYTENGEEF